MAELAGQEEAEWVEVVGVELPAGLEGSEEDLEGRSEVGVVEVEAVVEELEGWVKNRVNDKWIEVGKKRFCKWWIMQQEIGFLCN